VLAIFLSVFLHCNPWEGVVGRRAGPAGVPVTGYANQLNQRQRSQHQVSTPPSSEVEQAASVQKFAGVTPSRGWSSCGLCSLCSHRCSTKVKQNYNMTRAWGAWSSFAKELPQETESSQQLANHKKYSEICTHRLQKVSCCSDTFVLPISADLGVNTVKSSAQWQVLHSQQISTPLHWICLNEGTRKGSMDGSGGSLPWKARISRAVQLSWVFVVGRLLLRKRNLLKTVRMWARSAA
jgi:hypothetical protein